jgi:signal transduction histidine kinase/ligand-binding sensor domain-containing protein
LPSRFAVVWFPLDRSGCLALAVAAVLLAPVTGSHAQTAGVDRYQPLERMHHTAWTARDGLSGRPSSLAQTADGFLWIGTSDGLYRFDGLRFEPYRPAHGALAARAVSTLTAAPGGGLWVGFESGGVTFLDARGRASSWSPAHGLPVARIRAIAVDLDGTAWVAATGGLARLGSGAKQWQRIRRDWGYPHSSAWSVFVDRRGTLWVGAASPDGVLFLPRGGRRFIELAVTGSARAFGELRDGTLVYSHRLEPTVHLVRHLGDSAALFQTLPDLRATTIAVDREGGVWTTGRAVQRVRLTSSARGSAGGAAGGSAGGAAWAVGPVERLPPEDGLSGAPATDLLVDREGTVWMTTSAGLDRFRHRNLTWDRDTTLAGGGSLLTGADGRVWILSLRPPTLRDGRDRSAVPDAPAPLDNGYVDRDGALWLSNQQALYRWDGKRFTAVPPPREVVDNRLRFTVVGAVRDRAGRLWISVAGSGVFVQSASGWTFKSILRGRPDMAPPSLAADAQGRVWLLYRDELAMVAGDRVRIYTAADGLDIGALTSVRTGEGRVWVTGERGFALLQGDRFHPVNHAVPSVLGLGVVTGSVPTSDGLWLTTTTGIGHVPREELARLAADPTARIRVELFDLVSDLPEPLRFAARPFRWGTEAGDGVLWFVTRSGIARVDPRRIVRNRLPPPIAFRAVIADGRTYAPQEEIRLPPLTRTLRIEYTALSLVIPERVRFRHRLEGWEDRWQDAGDRREVSYTDLGPGTYRLHVTACNNDGVWNAAGATLRFTVAPAWFQTTLFRVFSALLLLALAAAAFRYRIRRVSAALAARYDERLAERTRIARDLHDTLLQTLQGSKLVADEALDRPHDTDRLRHALERVSEWLGQAVEEGRAALGSLRGAAAASDLAAALRRAADNPARPPNLAVAVVTRGVPRPLHPVVQEEVYRIGLEGIRNACLHAHANHLAIELEYGRDLVLKMADDGIGLAAALAQTGEAGKPGHFGLQGMRERADSIGALLAVESTNPGTRITLVVPGRNVFRAGLPAGDVDAFVAAWDKAVAGLYPQGPASPDYTSIVSARHHDRLRGLLDDARAKGARILETGRSPEQARSRPHTLPPTLVLDVHDGMKIMAEEIFGPVLPIATYAELDDAIDFVNARPRPLALYWFGSSAAHRNRVLARTTSGGVAINSTLLHYAQDDLPFGGVGPSGFGAYHGIEGFRTFSHQKAVFHPGRWNGSALLRPPFGRLTDFAVSWLLR